MHGSLPEHMDHPRCLEAANLLLSLEKDGPVPRLSSTLPNSEKKGLWLFTDFDRNLISILSEKDFQLNFLTSPLFATGVGEQSLTCPTLPCDWFAAKTLHLLSLVRDCPCSSITRKIKFKVDLQVVSHPNTITFFAIALSVLLWLWEPFVISLARIIYCVVWSL